MSTRPIENYNAATKYNGFRTNKAATFGSTVAITGALTATAATTTVGTLVAGAVSATSLTNTGTITGGKLAVTASGGATRTLTAANSGSVNLFDAATSIAYTLPAPVVGLYYDFLWTALETGGQAHNIVTDAGTTYCVGYVTVFSDVNITPSATLGPKAFAGAAADTYVKITMNGTTTGGGIGTWLRFTCISATAWNVSGIVRSPSGTIATPFSV